jgi:hypothetical protein
MTRGSTSRLAVAKNERSAGTVLFAQLQRWLVLVLILALVGGATILLFAGNIYDVYMMEFIAPQLEKDLGFRIGKIKVVDGGRQFEVPAIVIVQPGGVFGRAGFLQGDIPTGYMHGFVGFYYHLNGARGREATIRVLRPETLSWTSAREVRVSVPNHSRTGDRPVPAASTDGLQVYRQIRLIRVGAKEAEVLRVAGGPSRTEVSPFPPDSLPMKPGCKACEATSDCRLLPAVRRAHYEWRIQESKATTKIEELDVYYDTSNVVTCTHRTFGMEMTWSWH